MQHTIEHRVSGAKGAFYIAGEGGAPLAEMTYSRTNDTLIVIDHTEVDPSLKGQGVGRRLLDAQSFRRRGARCDGHRNPGRRVGGEHDDERRPPRGFAHCGRPEAARQQ